MFKTVHLGALNKWQSFFSWLLLLLEADLCEIRGQHQGQRLAPNRSTGQQVRRAPQASDNRETKTGVAQRDSTTDTLCKLRHESQHGQQREDREGHKGGGSSILIPTSEKQKMLTIDTTRIPLRASAVVNGDGKAAIMAPWEDG